MQTKAIETLQELENVVWFSAVGSAQSKNIISVQSWQEAMLSCGSYEWEDLCLEAVNQFGMRVLERDASRYNQWNDVVDSVKEICIPFVKRKIQATVDQNSLPKEFEDTVQWDILHLCMEAEFSDVFPPGFYASQAYWYSKGHFPCGWQGKFPAGKLIVF
jgi:hypothetical protein